MLVFTGPANENVKVPKAESSTEQQTAAVTPDAVCRPSSEQQASLDKEKKAYGRNEEVVSMSPKLSLQTGSWPSISQSSSNQGKCSFISFIHQCLPYN